MSELVRRRFIIENALRERINDCRDEAAQSGIQGLLFDNEDHFRVTPEITIAFQPDSYPAKDFCKDTHFQKHFYSLVGAMDSEEEKICAQNIDIHKNVETWVRNIPRDPFNSFWLPTYQGKFYPDFVVKLKDGTCAAIEYKGEHLVNNEDTKHKNMIGKIWADKSGGLCRFLMAFKIDNQGHDLHTQINEFLL